MIVIKEFILSEINYIYSTESYSEMQDGSIEEMTYIRISETSGEISDCISFHCIYKTISSIYVPIISVFGVLQLSISRVFSFLNLESNVVMKTSAIENYVFSTF